MKRILLFLVFVFLCLSSTFSQQYKIEITGYIGRGESDCGTINGLKGVYLLYSGGTRSSNLHLQGSYYHNKSFSFSATINQSQRPYAVRFETKERHRNFFGDCVGGDGNKEVAISYPCKDTSYTNSQVFHSDINGNARIKIYPIVDVKYPDGTNISSIKTVCETGYTQVAATVTGHSSYATTYQWEFKDPVNTVSRRTSSYQTLYDRYIDYYQDYNDCVNSSGGGDLPYALKSTNKVAISKEKTVEEEDANIIAARPIIPIDGGGACDYWYTRYNTAWIAYRDYSGTKYYEEELWRALNKNGQTTVTLRLSDFYTNEADRKEALNNKILNVRLNPGCDNDDAISNNTARIQFLPEPPEIAKAPTADSPSCSYDEIENFTLYFKRQLYSHEKLEVNLLKKFQDGTYVPIEDNVNITSLTSVSSTEYKHEWISGGEVLTGGDYRMVVSGFDRSNNSPFCEDYTYNFTITIPAPVVFESAIKEQDETCFGANDGKIKINASGGTGLYRYSLNNGTTWSTATFSGETTVTTASGTHLVKIRDSNNCIDQERANVSVTINSKSKITHVLGVPINTSAIGQVDGVIVVTSITGGTPSSGSYDYQILNASDSEITSGTIAASGGTISGLPIGTHKIVYTDANNCPQEYTLPQISNPVPLDFTVTSQEPDCYEGFGKIVVSNITGGYPNYKITISKTDGGYTNVIENAAGNTTNTVDDVLAGNYKITIKDTRLNAIVEKNTTVNVQTEVEISNIVNTEISCYDETSQVTISATGGKSNEYQYAIYKATNIVWQDSNVFDLAANNTSGYRFVVRDKNIIDCKSDISDVLRIEAPTPIDIDNEIIKDNTIFGASVGEIAIDISGGTPSYDVDWQKQGDASFSRSGSIITGLRAGFYIATITDQKGCSFISEIIEVKENPEFKIVSLDIDTDIVCHGDLGSLSVILEGGAGVDEYEYQWYKNGDEIVGETSNTLIDVEFALYKVVVYDGYVTLDESKTLNNPSKVTLAIEKTDITCFGKDDGKIKVNPQGGSGIYFYSIDDRTTYFNTNTLIENTITDLVEGTYQVWLKDDKDCEIEIPLEAIIGSPTEIKIDSFTVINCDIIGTSEGAISIEVSGGEGNFTYSWTKEGDTLFSSDSQNISSLGAGFYNVSIQDTKGCIIIERYEVKEPLPLEVSVEQTNQIICFGEETGALLANVIGGYPISSTPTDFSYKWYLIEETGEILLNTDETRNEISNLKAGNYKVTVNDVKGTTASSLVFEIIQPLQLGVVFSSKENVSCNGGEDGTIDITIVGGTEGYTFSWTKDDDAGFSEISEDISELDQGIYNVFVEDANGCTTSLLGIEITQPIEPVEIDTFVITNLTGFEEGDGSILITPKGGTPDYNYEWTVKGEVAVLGTESKIENLQIGDYEVTITDSKGCQIVREYNVIQPDLLEITSITQASEVLCYGDKQVILNTEVLGGVPPYTYNWYVKGSTVSIADTSSLANIGAGEYVVEVTDANQIKIAEEYEVLQPTILEVATINTVNISCFNGTDGSISITPTGGVAPYTFSWNHTTETTNELLEISSGIYTVTIRDKNLCSIVQQIEVTQPTKGLIAVEETIAAVTGNGLSNGSVTVKIEGGTEPYTYQWVYEGTILDEETTQNITDKLAGSYTLNILDAKSCALSLVYEIEEPLLLEASIKETSILCNGEEGILTSEVNGGVPPYEYYWYNTDEELINSTASLSIVSGVYSFEVIDANGNREKIEGINLEQPEVLEIDTLAITNVTCYNGSDGIVAVEVLGGTGDKSNYTYSWSNGRNGSSLENMTAGSYSLTITDENGCTLTKDDIVISEPETFKIATTKLVRPTYEETSDGSIEITIIGGQATYTYLWKDENGVVVSNTTSSDQVNSIENLKQGTYSITITDGISCSIEETYNLANPGELLVSIEQLQEISCFSGSNAVLSVITVGGVGGNNYSWYNTNDDTQIIGDKKELSNVPAGSYYVVVNNAEGIEEKSSIFEVTEPSEVNLIGTASDVSCYESSDGTIAFNVSGGSEEYQYRYRASSDSFSDWTSINTEEVIVDNLEAIEYIIQVRGVVGDYYCLATDPEDLDNDFTFIINQPNLLQITDDTIVNTTGFGLSNGSIDITVAAGTAPYTYRWQDADNTTLPQTSNTLTNIGAGSYTVRIRDAKGCRTSSVYTVEQPSLLTASIELSSVISCKGEENGSLLAKASGGLGDYVYTWFKEDSATAIGFESVVSNIGTGNYYVEVEDSNGNKATSDTYFIEEPESLTVELFADYVLCGIGEDWTITSKVEGGTAPYSYLWSTGEYTATIEEVVLETYEVTVVDAKGCTQVTSITLEAPDTLKIDDFTITDPTCYGGEDGGIEINVIGGASPYTYKWNNSSTAKDVNGLKEGTYEVVVTDSKGCSILNSFEITNPEEITVDLGEDVTLCKGQTYITDATIDEGIAYKWSSDNGFSSDKPSVEFVERGIYTVEITTDLGCLVTDTIEINISDQDIDSEFIVSSVVYTDESIVMINISDYTFDEVTWFFPDNAEIIHQDNEYAEISIKEEGDYEITLKTRLGDCERIKTKNVLVVKKEFDADADTVEGDKQMLESVNLYPNPSSGFFNLDIALKEETTVNVKIYKLNSTIIHYQNYHDKDLYELDYNFNLPTGVYFVLVETKKDRMLKKLIIQ